MADTGKPAPEDLHVETTDEGLSHLHNAGLHDKALANAALEATVQEHNIGVFQAFKTYKRAAFWSIRMSLLAPRKRVALIRPVISTTVIMEGYDVTLLSSFYGYPSFREKYGDWLDDKNGYQISADWQQRFNCLARWPTLSARS